MINKKGKRYKNRKETNKDIANRILNLAEPGGVWNIPSPYECSSCSR